MMKKKLLSLTLLAGMSLGTQASDYKYLVFTMTDGSTKGIEAQGLKITVADGVLTVTNGTETLNLQASALTKMEFSNDESAGISAVSIDDVKTGNAQIYDLQGKRMTQSFDNLPKGVYVVKGKKINKQ